LKSGEKGLTQKSSAFILGLATSTFSDHYKAFLERVTGSVIDIHNKKQNCPYIFIYKIYIHGPIDNIDAAYDQEDIGVGKSGRLPILDATGKADAIVAIEKRCGEGHGFAAVGSFKSFIEPFVRGIHY
jgi:hypothetical protein